MATKPLVSPSIPNDVSGAASRGYGFDLSPMSARVEEFEDLYAQLQAERELCLRLKRQITVARRMIRARIIICDVRKLVSLVPCGA